MSTLANELTKYTDYLIAAYDMCQEKNAIIPEERNLYNLSACIQSIPAPTSYRIMTVQIDTSNSDPETSLTYADDAIGMTPGDSAWDTFFGHYPVLFKNGAEVGKLNPNNFNQYRSGLEADITSGDSGDVMIAFPRRGIKIFTNGNILTISMTDNPNDPNFTYYAHSRGNIYKDKFYLGAYKGYVLDNKIRSLSGKEIDREQSCATCREQAQNNGQNYELSGFYQLVFRQCMYILKYKYLDSQLAVGMGYVDITHTEPIPTGGTESWGMDCELIKITNSTYLTDQNHHMKLFGLEDFWGNIYEWIDGVITDANLNILTATTDFNDNATGYTNQGPAATTTSRIYGYLLKSQGTSELGFIAKEATGKSTTEVWEYYCDVASIGVSCGARFGGFWNDNRATGCFLLSVSTKITSTADHVGSRLMYL